jgi:uncharacterized protein (TIGR02246 family)
VRPNLAEDRPPSIADDVAAIRRLRLEWDSAVRERDVPKILSLVTGDVLLLMPGRPPIMGKAELASVYHDAFARFSIEQTVTTEEIQVSGDIAFMWGMETIVGNLMSGGASIVASGYGMVILKRESDGCWRLARGVNNTAVRPRASVSSI